MISLNGWILTEDWMQIHGYDSWVGFGRHPETKKIKFHTKEDAKALPDRFALYDDDGNRLVSGRFDVNSDDPFEPLDVLQDELGATELRYQEKGVGKWQQL